MKKYLLDTHTWIWFNGRPGALSDEVRQILTAGGYDELLIAASSIWEFCRFVNRGQLALSISTEDWISQALDYPGLRISPLTPQIACQSTMLPGTPPRDPIDQIILATARVENAVILSKDPAIGRYPFTKTIW